MNKSLQVKYESKLSSRVFRFAPSPNGFLHLGHAYSAIVNYEMAKKTGGRFLLRMEDIDFSRCSPEFEHAIKEDLAWLGLKWEEPVLRQSDHFEHYERALEKLKELGVVYEAVLSRKEVRNFADSTADWPRDPEGTPHYPPENLVISRKEREFRLSNHERKAVRLDMKKALQMAGEALCWREFDKCLNNETRTINADPLAWGDVAVARKDTPTSYHLSVAIDDSLQGVTDIVRGNDLYWSTSVHRLLQKLLDFQEPEYFHHRLVLDSNGKKLSKSDGHTSLRSLRENGITVSEIREKVGLGQ